MRRRVAVVAASGFAVIVAAFCALAFGSAKLSIGEVVEGLFRVGGDGTNASIIHAVRLPRCLAALLAGVGLATSGALLQSATGNPLAGPNIIGVNAGAGFSMVLIGCLFPLGYRLMPLAAAVGAFGCTALIALLAAKAGGERVTIVLAGVAISTLFSAGISMVRMIFPDISIDYAYFSIGGVSGVSLKQLAIPSVIIFSCVIAAFCVAQRLDLLLLGDDAAAGLGVRTKGLRTFALLLSGASAAAAVSFAGLLGFVGLMSPHIARRLLGSERMRLVLPVSAMIGGALTVTSDLVGRLAFAPSEVPAGVFLAILGVPFFLTLLVGKRGRI